MIRLFMLCLLAASGYAATITSNGAGGGAATSGASWAGGVAPGSADTAVIANGDTITNAAGVTWTVGPIQCVSDLGTGTVVNNGVINVGGNMRGCMNNWTVGPGGAINATATITFIMPKALLVVSGASGSVATLTASSTNTVGFTGQAQINYASTHRWSFTEDLVSAGQKFSLSNSVLDAVTSINVYHVDPAAIWDVHDSTFTNPAVPAGNIIVFGSIGTLSPITTGIRNFSNNTVMGGGVMIEGGPGVDTGMTVRYNKFYCNTNTCSSFPVNSHAPIFSADNFRDNFFWEDRTSGGNTGLYGNIPNGILLRNMFYVSDQNCSADRVGSYAIVDNNIANLGLPYDTQFIDGIFDVSCSYGISIMNKAYGGASPWSVEVSGTIVTGNDTGTALYGSIVSYANCLQTAGNYCGTGNIHHNTIQGPPYTGVTGLATNHDPTGWAGMMTNVSDNLVYRNASPGAGNLIRYVGTQPGQYQTVDYNWVDSTITSTASSYYQGYGTSAYTSTPGVHDHAGDAQMVDKTRTFATWCAMRGTSSLTACFTKFQINTSNYDPAYNVSDMIDWIRAGYAPQNPAVATADHTGASWAGAVPPPTTLGAAPRSFFSDITSGPNTGGENNKGAYVCVFGKNFGTSRGTSTITVGGGAVDNYPVWVDEGLTSHRPASSRVCFQLGASAATGDIIVTVDGTASNPLPFTVRATGTSPDGIWCVSPTTDGTYPGSDSNNGHFTTNGNGGTGCKATWVAARAAGFGAGDIVYMLGPVATTIESSTGDGSYAYYKLPGGNENPAMPEAFLGYPGRSFDLGSNDATYKIIDMGSPGTHAANWVLGNVSVRCNAQRGCVSLDLVTVANGWSGLHHDNRIINVKVQAPKADASTTAAVSITDALNTTVYGMELTNIGCGFGNTLGTATLGVDGSDAVNQSEQYRCGEYVVPSNATLTTAGTAVTSSVSTTFTNLAIGTHICYPDCATAERVVMAITDGSHATLNAAFPVDLTGVTAHYVPKLSVTRPAVHAIYPGRMLVGADFGWMWIHNNNSIKGMSQNPNGLNVGYVASTTANAEPGTGAAQVVLVGTCSAPGIGSYGPNRPCQNGDPVSISDTDASSVALPAGYDPAVIGSWYLKAIDQTSFYLYQDAALTIPVTGTTNCSNGTCGLYVHGIMATWNFSFHDSRVEYQNAAAVTLGALNPSRGPVRIYNNVFAHNGQGPNAGGYYGAGLSMTNLNFTDSMAAYTGYKSGTVEVFNNTFYDIGNWTSPDASNTHQAVYGGAIATAHFPHLTFALNNNLIHSAWSTRGLMFLTSEPTYTGAKNIYYGGSTGADYGGVAMPSVWTSTAIPCTAPCDPFTDAANGVFTLASSSGAASSGGIVSSATKDLAGLTRPQGATYSIGAYEPTGLVPATVRSWFSGRFSGRR